ncbi:MAG: hypothetical protein R8G01_20675 [Ilumatobacteraceae bacterium]|nr:hypothetical protein [Ilumatobacteraceae bacterium]
MSRFDEQFDHDLSVIAERVSPSPTAWEEIQQRIADRAPNTETEIIMLTDNTLTKRRWPLVAAAAAVAALAITGIALVNRGDGEELPADVPTPTVAPDGADEQTTDSATPDEQTADGQLTGEPIAEPSAPPFPAVGVLVDPGVYASAAIGTPFTIELGEGSTAPWTVISNDENGVQIWSDDTAREFIALGRIGSWMNFDEARDEQHRGAGSIPGDDLDGWIAANGVIVVDSAEVEVGGRPAKYRQVRLDTTPGATADWCPPSEVPCLWAANGSADLVADDQTPVPFARDRLHSIWLVDMGEFEPVVILAIPNLDDEEAWFADIVQPIVDSIVFGEPAPVIEGGTARVPLREQFFASYTTPRSEGTELADGTIERSGTFTITGDLTGEIASTGIELTPANGYDDLVFTGTIDGIGTGTLTMYQEWTGSANGDISFTTTITDATGDFTGITGRMITALDQPDESGPEPVYTARVTFLLAIPVTG